MTGRRVVVVGAGHQGLVAALHLARSGCDVTVVEQGTEPGGCVWTETRADGVVVERGAYEHGGVLATALDLGLDHPALGERAVTYREHPVATGFVFGDGERRVFRTDLDATLADLGDDVDGYRAMVTRADVLFGMLDAFDEPPTLTRVASSLVDLPGGDDLLRTLLQPAEVVAAAYLDDPHTRAAVCLQAAHAQVPAWAPGSGMFAFLLPSSHGGPAVRPVGGSRALVDALVAALELAGGGVRCGSGVASMRTSDVAVAGAAPQPAAESLVAAAGVPARVGVFGGAPGRRSAVPVGADRPIGGERPALVVLDDGTTFEADVVISTVGLPRTAALITEPVPRMREAADSLHSGHFNVAELTVTVVTEQPVALPIEDPDAVWYAVADPADVRTGFGEILAGRLPSSPWSMVSQVAQPEGVAGGAVWLSSVVPLERADGPWTPEREREAGERLVDHVGSVLGVDLRAGLVELVVSGPATWAQRIGGDGSPNHVDLTVDQLLGWRPPGHADQRTELPWLFLAGAGVHPGGGLSGASGTAAAAAVLGRPRGAAGAAGRARDEVRGLWRGFQAYRTMRRGQERPR